MLLTRFAGCSATMTNRPTTIGKRSLETRRMGSCCLFAAYCGCQAAFAVMACRKAPDQKNWSGAFHVSQPTRRGDRI